MLAQRGRVVVEKFGGGEGDVVAIRVESDVVAAGMKQRKVGLDKGSQLPPQRSTRASGESAKAGHQPRLHAHNNAGHFTGLSARSHLVVGMKERTGRKLDQLRFLRHFWKGPGSFRKSPTHVRLLGRWTHRRRRNPTGRRRAACGPFSQQRRDGGESPTEDA